MIKENFWDSVKGYIDTRLNALDGTGLKASLKTMFDEYGVKPVYEMRDQIHTILGMKSNIETTVSIKDNVNKVANAQSEVIVVSNDIENENHLKTVADMITTGVKQGSVVWEPSHNGIQFMDQTSGTTNIDGSPLTTIVIPKGKNAFSIDNYTLDDGVTLVIEDGSTYKVI